MNVYDDGAGNEYVSGFADGVRTQKDTKLALYSADIQNTNGTFNYQSGDVLKTTLIQKTNTTTIPVGALWEISIRKNFLLLESGDNLLLEDGNRMVL
jgi:hypothetical protein